MLYFFILVLALSVANTLFIGALLYLILKILPKMDELKASFGKSKKKTN
jgi:hypothetical protein